MNGQIKCWRCSQLISVNREIVGQEVFCPNCGSKNGVPAEAFGAPPTQSFSPSVSPATIPNYLWQAIVVTLLCCVPFGIVAIVFAASVNSKLAVGDVHGARAASSSARTWCWVSFLCGLVGVVLWFLVVLASGA